mmetsp:Transcript_5407/g.13167  ORF Transcript_5407/g.13167 Transcript_5407/m.13167 type:complete len:312 (-) Transcript_5407:987-1922(-)
MSPGWTHRPGTPPPAAGGGPSPANRTERGSRCGEGDSASGFRAPPPPSTEPFSSSAAAGADFRQGDASSSLCSDARSGESEPAPEALPPSRALSAPRASAWTARSAGSASPPSARPFSIAPSAASTATAALHAKGCATPSGSVVFKCSASGSIPAKAAVASAAAASSLPQASMPTLSACEPTVPRGLPSSKKASRPSGVPWALPTETELLAGMLMEFETLSKSASWESLPSGTEEEAVPHSETRREGSSERSTARASSRGHCGGLSSASFGSAEAASRAGSAGCRADSVGRQAPPPLPASSYAGPQSLSDG